ncbi:hypothetical protein KY321_02480, partial [Candidatus Woesearchaeota archaeon]|nr:hypothetical protein [Candidatus Woesearchaeota archaeon]
MDEENNKGFLSKNKWVLPVVLILIAIFASSHFRMYSADLPITEDWARSSVENGFKNQILSQVNEEFPTLPDQNKQKLVNDRFEEYKRLNKGQIDSQTKAYSTQIKSNFQYDYNNESYTYLLAIDPYLWYGYGKNYLECGDQGCDNTFGENQNLRNGRFGKERDMAYISYLGVATHKVLNFFGDYPLMYAFFLIPVIMIGLSTIPAFFLAKKFGGNLGGFMAAMIVALNGALLGRTPAGFSDTDSANILFPLLIMWFFVEAVYSKDIKKSMVYSVLGGISFFLFSKFWIPAPFFDMVVAAFGLYLVIKIIKYFKGNEELKIKQFIKNNSSNLIKGISFIVISLVFLIISQGFNFLVNLIKQPLRFMFLKEVGISSLWPNVLTTVAEFNTVPLAQIIGQMGGPLPFSFALFGLGLSAYLYFRKDNRKNTLLFFSILIIWFFGTGYSFTKGVRFAILMVPAFAVAFGTGVGLVYKIGTNWLSEEFKVDKTICSYIFLAVSLLLLISPISEAGRIAKNEVPSYNDAWDATLESIQEDAEDGKGYITTWWDFGHWFVAKGSRVTFDGGDQGERIHWVGKLLLTEDEELSKGILRMLNCGQQEAPHALERALDNDTVLAIKVLDEIMVKGKDEATAILESYELTNEEIIEILNYTHCDNLLPQYVIASEDMVSKSGVWGHFGSWDFEKAKMYQTTKSLDYVKGINNLKDNFGLNDEDASKYYSEIQNTKADRWIAGWPSYFGGQRQCQQSDNNLMCSVVINRQTIPISIDLNTYEAKIEGAQETIYPNSLVYIKGDEVVEKEFKGQLLGMSAILINENNRYSIQMADPNIANSIFTKIFYFGGHGLQYYEPFKHDTQVTGQEIYTYKIDWNSETKTD